MNTSEPRNFIPYLAIILICISFAFIDYYFFRNTKKERNWKMFIYVGVIALVVGGLFIYTTYL
jgi:uncharacterized membrane protein